MFCGDLQEAIAFCLIPFGILRKKTEFTIVKISFLKNFN